MLNTVIAFKDYNVVDGVWGSDWAGFKHFERFFNNPVFWPVLQNTFILSAYVVLASFPALFEVMGKPAYLTSVELIGGVSTDVARFEFAGAPPHHRQILALVRAIRGEGPVVCTGEDGLDAVRLVFAAYDSAQTNRPVRLGDEHQTLESAAQSASD